MSNLHNPIAARILQHLESAGRTPVDRFTLLRDMSTQGAPSGAVSRALELLVQRGDLRRVGTEYIRVGATLSPVDGDAVLK